MSDETNAQPTKLRVVLADSRCTQSQLLAQALRDQGFGVHQCPADVKAVLQVLEGEACDVLVVNTSCYSRDVSPLRTVHLTTPQLAKVALLDGDDRELVVQAFRSGARGVFCLADFSFASLCECIERVGRGEIWASSRHLGYLLDSVSQTPTLQVLTSAGEKLLTCREEQVVALVADGLSNRSIASEMGLSEHTVKKYLFRIFEKLGISNRVELVLYAVHHGEPTQTAWVASA
jgi:DNA-binding NarL/FixJ family response regulator